MNLIESTNNNNQMEVEFAGQMVERHDIQAPGLLEVRLQWSSIRILTI